jgi:uncharacterized protein (TIGR02301 family)
LQLWQEVFMKCVTNQKFSIWKMATAMMVALMCTFVAVTPSLAIDPPYQSQMERLTEVLGSLYFLQPLCGETGEDWRLQASELINLDNPDEDRRQRLTGAFNAGYEAYARVYRSCTSSARAAIAKLLVEAEQSAREIHTRFAE